VFANRFTALADACALVPALNRNLLLSLAEAEFFRVRWSARILDETERAIAKLMRERGADAAADRAQYIPAAMERAFEDASVTGHERLIGSLGNLPDPADAHVIAAAVKTRASVIITDNVRHFPLELLRPLDLEAKTVDAFLADTIGLDTGRAVAAIRRMRERLKRPEKTPEVLLLDMEAVGLTQTVDALREHLLSL
jgi:hypothetical protein